jgi:hypothetical protein
METYIKIRKNTSTIATVSNCGGIMMAAKYNAIHWLGNQFEDEEWP